MDHLYYAATKKYKTNVFFCYASDVKDYIIVLDQVITARNLLHFRVEISEVQFSWD